MRAGQGEGSWRQWGTVEDQVLAQRSEEVTVNGNAQEERMGKCVKGSPIKAGGCE